MGTTVIGAGLGCGNWKDWPETGGSLAWDSAWGGTFDFKKWVASDPDERFEICAITAAELWLRAGTGNGKAECRSKVATFKARCFAQIKGLSVIEPK